MSVDVVAPVAGVVTGGPGGGAVHAGAPDIAVAWSTGTVATTAPVESIPTADVPVAKVEPVVASTTTPDAGLMTSTTAPVGDISCAEDTPLPTCKATQETGPPSASPNDPEPTTPIDPGSCPLSVAIESEALHTAWASDSSRVSAWHPDTWAGWVSIGPEPVELPLLPGPLLVEPPLPAVPVTAGWAHIAPNGHCIGVGSTPTDGHGTSTPQPAIDVVGDR